MLSDSELELAVTEENFADDVQVAFGE